MSIVDPVDGQAIFSSSKKQDYSGIWGRKVDYLMKLKLTGVVQELANDITARLSAEKTDPATKEKITGRLKQMLELAEQDGLAKLKGGSYVLTLWAYVPLNVKDFPKTFPYHGDLSRRMEDGLTTLRNELDSQPKKVNI